MMLKRFSLGLLAWIAVTGSVRAQQAHDAILGSWKSDVAKTRKLLVSKGVKDPERVLGRVDDLAVTFNADGTCTVSEGDHETALGRWELENTDQEFVFQLVLSENIDGGNELRAKLTINDDGTITIEPNDEDPVVFAKVGEQATPLTREALVGKWNGSPEESKKVNGDDEPQQVAEMVGGMKLEVRADGSYTMTMVIGDAENKTEGKWELGESHDDGKTHAFHAKTEDEALVFKVWLNGQDVLVFQQPEADFVTAFVRQKKK